MRATATRARRVAFNGAGRDNAGNAFKPPLATAIGFRNEAGGVFIGAKDKRLT